MHLAAFFGSCPFFAAELTVLERAEHLKRRKEIYEAKYPETKHGGDRRSEEAKSRRNDFVLIPSFAEDTAAKLGVSPRTYEARYPEARATTGRELANKRWHASEKISPASFSEATATNLGVSPRTVQQEVQIAERLADDVLQ